MLDEALRLDREGRIPDAIAAYQRLLEHWPGLPDSWYNLGLLQRKSGDYDAALASYKEALERNVAQPEQVHLNRAVIYSDCLRQYPAAEQELEKALARNPGYLPALLNLANLHEDLGRRDRAGQTYERILALEPDSAQALARYTGTRTFSSVEDPLIGRMQRTLERAGISAADRAAVEFALGRALDGCGAYDAAFEAYRSANRHSRESAGPNFQDYDLGLEERLRDRIIQAFPAATAGAPQNLAPRPIFVCGMFRSGSTLLEQLLAGHPRVTAGGELSFLPNAVGSHLAPFPESMASPSPQVLETLAADYLNMLREIFPQAQNVTDKRPGNFVYIGLIKRLFPDAKILHTTRDALDNCLSIYFLHLDQNLSYALDLMDIGHHYLQYRRLMAHWKALFGADILDVNYDALVKEPEPVMERVLGFLGLEWDERCLTVPPAGRAIKTASVWQAREPIYQRSSGRARHYAHKIQLLRDYLGQ
jgi:tetratricopeptide (TPR) repeat protein